MSRLQNQAEEWASAEKSELAKKESELRAALAENSNLVARIEALQSEVGCVFMRTRTLLEAMLNVLFCLQIAEVRSDYSSRLEFSDDALKLAESRLADSTSTRKRMGTLIRSGIDALDMLAELMEVVISILAVFVFFLLYLKLYLLPGAEERWW